MKSTNKDYRGIGQRICAAILFTFFFVLLFAPLAATATVTDASLPACCRRDGKHHCIMTMSRLAAAQGSHPEFKAPADKCPYSPLSPVRIHDLTSLSSLQDLVSVKVMTCSIGQAQTKTRRRILYDRSQQKRGPPVPSSLSM